MERTGTFTSATTGSTATVLTGKVNMSLWGTFSATVQPERSFDSGTTWIPMSTDSIGTLASYTAPMSIVVEEVEGFPGTREVQYRWNCTAYTSGTVNYRIGQSIPT